MYGERIVSVAVHGGRCWYKARVRNGIVWGMVRCRGRETGWIREANIGRARGSYTRIRNQDMCQEEQERTIRGAEGLVRSDACGASNSVPYRKG